uniref:Uncharacterized protein n=1 Tax=Heterorhabditis bacteriophora TaxID=37862 RepID=A0A1I7W9P4_HETBA
MNMIDSFYTSFQSLGRANYNGAVSASIVNSCGAAVSARKVFTDQWMDSSMTLSEALIEKTRNWRHEKTRNIDQINSSDEKIGNTTDLTNMNERSKSQYFAKLRKYCKIYNKH